jgi:hypothetical protein
VDDGHPIDVALVDVVVVVVVVVVADFDMDTLSAVPA